MELRPEHLPSYLDLTRPDLSGEPREQKIAALRERLADGRWDPALRRVALDEAGRMTALLWAFEPFPGDRWLAGPRCLPGAEGAVGGLLAELVAEARSRGWPRLQARLKEADLTPSFRAALAREGFAQTGARVEYKTPVADLPAEGDSPLRWAPYTEIGLAAAGALIERAGAGPDLEDDDVGADLIRDYLGQEGMTGSADCVQIGSVDGEPVAFVVAQVEPATGWSTITFMGVVPERRGQGLGPWVQRRGFTIFRRHGGALYHGGTSMENAPMRRLFERHGCQVYARFEEFSAALDAADFGY